VAGEAAAAESCSASPEGMRTVVRDVSVFSFEVADDLPVRLAADRR
jgi:hypothetical protein